jgi:energy-coupling factor transport system permease protein
VIYERRPSPLHAARAWIGAVWCVTLGLVALSTEQPVVLGVLLASVLGAAFAARAGRRVALALAWGLPFALVIALVNTLVTRDGVTVLVRGFELPALGAMDITLEAVVFSAVLGLRFLIVIGCAGLLAATVDPDELLRAVRRVSVRSGVTAAVATRLVPVLARDARRLDEARRTVEPPAHGGRAGGGRARGAADPRRLAVLRAVTTGALDRATDVAATLEVRGFALARRGAHPPERRPWSRHDLAFAFSTLALAVIGVAAAVEDWGAFRAFPRLGPALGAEPLLLAAALAASVLLPFADRRGVGR